LADEETPSNVTNGTIRHQHTGIVPVFSTTKHPRHT